MDSRWWPFLCLLFAGCVTPVDGDRGIPPFYVEREETLPDGDKLKSQHFWPFYSSAESSDMKETRILWPLYMDRTEPNRNQTWIIPIYHRSVYNHSETRKDIDGFLLPILLWGSDPEEGDYLALGPLGGTIKGLLGKDRIDYLLFPLWARLQDRDQVAEHYLFPIAGRDYGPLRNGWRIFPFYGESEGTTLDGRVRDRSRTIMWPFWNEKMSRLDTDNPISAWWLWPFYGLIESNHRIQRSIAFPLWLEEHDSRTMTSSWSLFPWTIGTRKGNWNRVELYPFWGFHERAGISKGFTLWPFWQWESQKTGRKTREVRRLFPFWKSIDETKSNGESASERLLWPLARWQKSADGKTKGAFPALLPFDAPRGFNWSHGRATRLARWNKDSEGWDFELLWGLFTSSKRSKITEFSLLGGLISKERSERSDDTRWRLLYISF
ncbi:MAG: hypothetical protein H8E43_03330 [Planctomycetia bacterium]|nr:hypothetical protein [Planctomycetia bacterium]MBL6914460.1 hypothetical protein [Planctomycetota bacterium]HCW43795.1 hypothetical protein [Planctomycetota bacterium]